MQRRSLIILGIITIGVGAAVAVVAVLIHIRPPSDPSYLFERSNFARVASGMGPDQVRDLLGPPIWREFGQDGTSQWQYSAMPAGVSAGGTPTGIPKFTELTVYFDRSGHVSGHGPATLINRTDATTGTYPLFGPRSPIRPLRLEQWPLPMERGDPPRIGAGTSPVVVQVMASWCEPCGRERAMVESIVKRQVDGCRLVLVSVDENEAALQRYVKEHGIDEPVARQIGTELVGFDRQSPIPRYALLYDGWICWFDFKSVVGDPERVRDLEWFLKQRDLGRFGGNKPGQR